MAATFAAGLLAYAPAGAEGNAAEIAERIDAVFNVVPQNALDLAVPLTRRALARRFSDNPVRPYRPVAPAAPPRETTAESLPEEPRETAALPPVPALPPSPPAAAAPPAEAELDEGSADEGEADVARLPRPRPSSDAEAETPPSTAAMNIPLDLVASAAVETPPEAEPEPRAAAAEVLPPASPRRDTMVAVASTPSAEPPAAPAAIAAPAAPAAAPMGATAPEPPAAEPVPAAAAAAATPAETAAPGQPAAGSPAAVEAPPAEKIAAAAPPPAAPPPAGRPADLLASRACLAPGEATDGDGDLSRNEADLADLCLTEEKFKERRRPWVVHTIDSGRPGPLWAVMHDDEDLSFDNALHGLKTYGGVLVAVETGGKRNQDGIDPNRNLSADGIGCSKLGDDAAPRFTAAFREHLDASRPIVALHSNYDGQVPTGGLGHVSMDTVPPDMHRFEADDPDGPLAGAHALVLLATSDADAPSVKSRVDALTAKGVNVVVEPVNGERGDCSLSNYAVLSGHEDYFNVTVDHDEGEKQRLIVDAIMAGFSTVSAFN